MKSVRLSLKNRTVKAEIRNKKESVIAMSKKLVAYFSATGETKGVAEKLAEAAGADLYEICPETPYTTADLNWQDDHSRSSVEMKDKKFRPPIRNNDLKINEYDVVFLGFPIWWYVAPTIINTFLETYDFSGKTIVLFATSGGSGFGQTVRELCGSVSDSVVIKEGRLFNGRIAKKEFENWIQSLDL